MNRHTTAILAAAAVTLSAGSAFAQQILTVDSAVQTALQNHPRVTAAEGNVRQSELSLTQEDYRYTPILGADAGYRYGQSEQLSTLGTDTVTTDSAIVSAGLSQSLPVGTQLALEVEFGRSFRDSVELGDLGTAYDSAVRLQVTQPLLRGFGTDVGRAERELAKLDLDSSKSTRDAELDAFVAEVVNAYWAVWLAQKDLEIQREALEIAKRGLADGEVRIEAGDLAPSQLTSLRTEIARAEESVVAAETSLRQETIALGELLGTDVTTPIVVSETAPNPAVVPSVSEATTLAAKNSPQIVRLENNLKRSWVQYRVAKNNALPRLDAVASSEIGGIGETPATAFESLGEIDSVSFYAGLQFEIPLWNDARDAEAERAEVAAFVAEAELAAAKRDLEAQITILVEQLESSEKRLDLARTTAELARENVAAQRARFDAGRATSLEVVDAIQSQREADNRVIQLEVEQMLREVELRRRIGTLRS